MEINPKITNPIALINKTLEPSFKTPNRINPQPLPQTLHPNLKTHHPLTHPPTVNPPTPITITQAQQVTTIIKKRIWI